MLSNSVSACRGQTWAWESLRTTDTLEGLTRPAVHLVPAEDRSEASATALNLPTGGIGSISMSVDIDGTTYAGEAHARRPASVLLPDGPCVSASCLHTFPGCLPSRWSQSSTAKLSFWTSRG